MDYQESNDLLTGRCKQSRKMGNNTYLERRDDQSIAVKLHQTDVVTYYPNGDIKLNSGGYKTATTKERINTYAPVRLWQENFAWFMQDGLIFQDGEIIKKSGKIVEALKHNKKQDKLNKKIKQFTDNYIDALFTGKLDFPSDGDCWNCLMFEPSGLSSTSHLLNHFKEKYYVPSLIANAIKKFPVGSLIEHTLHLAFAKDPALSDYYKDLGKDYLHKSLLRYLRRQFGIA